MLSLRSDKVLESHAPPFSRGFTKESRLREQLFFKKNSYSTCNYTYKKFHMGGTVGENEGYESTMACVGRLVFADVLIGWIGI